MPFADCEPQGHRKLRPSRSSKALFFVRLAAGAPRRLRQRSASFLAERYAHDRAAIVVQVMVFVVIRAAFSYHRAIIGSQAYRVSVSRVYNRAKLSYVLLFPQ